MKIFVTGGTGFIGKYVVKKLHEDNHNLLILVYGKIPQDFPLKPSRKLKFINGNLADISSWKNAVKKFKTQATIHLAWEAIPLFDAKTSFKNLVQSLNLMLLMAEMGCKIFLSAGSCWEYGDQYGKLKEDGLVKPFTAFAAAKNSVHLMAKAIAKEFGMKFIWTRFFFVYGPGQKESSIIPHVIKSVIAGKKPQIKNLSAQNDFVYVEDVAEAIVMILNKSKEDYAVYNIGSGKLTSVGKIAKIIYSGFHSPFIFKLPKKKNKGFYADISKIKKEIGWRPKTSIETGIKKTIDYYKNL